MMQHKRGSTDAIPEASGDLASRFRDAQEAESQHHRDAWLRMRVGHLPYVQDIEDYKHWLESYNRVILSRFGFGGGFFQDKVLLEVGSGPFGMLEFIDARLRIAVDPLMQRFTSFMQPHWDPAVVRLAAEGERLPVASQTVDGVFVVNCLDHAIEPERIVLEISRCLKSGGHLFLSNNVKSALGVRLTRLGDRFRVRRLMEVHHPSPLSRRKIDSIAKKAGLACAGFYMVRGYLHSERQECSALNLVKRKLMGEQGYGGLYVRC